MIVLAFVLWILFGAFVIGFFMGASNLEDLQRRDSIRRRLDNRPSV